MLGTNGRGFKIFHIRARNPQILSPRACTPLPIACSFSKPHPRQERGGFRPMSGWNHQACFRVDEVLRSDSLLGTCVAIVQCAVSVEASSSTASSGTAAAMVVVSSHSIGSGLRVIARASSQDTLSGAIPILRDRLIHLQPTENK
jgi:hypothetical protein